jgi:hypothetical protein
MFDFGFLEESLERDRRKGVRRERRTRHVGHVCSPELADYSIRNLFEQLPQILKHGVFFVRARAISDKELLAQIQCLSLHCRGIKPVPYRSQELIFVHLTFSRVPCVINRSHIELIERYLRVPIELRERNGKRERP